MEAEVSEVIAASQSNASLSLVQGGSNGVVDERSLRRMLTYCFELLMALLSTIAVLAVASVSFAGYGLSILLGKISPLVKGYAFLSSTYDHVLERIGPSVLRDSRDTPALRLMVSITLTTVPIFVAQLVLYKVNLLLVVAFYLSLYGLKFNRFVRMFSVKHLEAHRRQGFFSDRYDKIFGHYVEFFLAYFYGSLPELDRTSHVRLHHKEHNGPHDTSDSRRFDRMSRWDFFSGYLTKNFWTMVGIASYRYFKAKGQVKNERRMLSGMVRYYSFFFVIFLYNWQIGILYLLIPLLAMNFITAIINWVQHAFYDPDHPDEYFAHTVTVLDEVNFMNEGYHLCHHHGAGLHWTEMPAHFDRLADRMRTSGSLVFRDIDFMDLFFEMTLLRRLDVLADKLVPWEPMTHEERVSLLKKRTQPCAILV